jgi:hypothetical protein
MLLRPVSLILLGTAASAALAGCGGDITLGPAIFENRTDTLQLWAATGTPVFRPSAYIIGTKSPARLDQISYFDFLYDITPNGEHILLPLAAVASTGTSIGNPGLLPTTTPYDSILIAEQTGYVTADTLPIRVGDIFYARSRPSSGCFLGIPYYAKLQVISIKDEDRSLYIQILSNVNCGYRSLEPGLPKK